MRYYTFSHLRGKLSSKEFFIYYISHEEGIPYMVAIHILRGDLVSKKWQKRGLQPKHEVHESYKLSVEKYDSRYDTCGTDMPLHLRLEFETLQEVIDYLNDSGILDKQVWIRDNPINTLEGVIPENLESHWRKY